MSVIKTIDRFAEEKRLDVSELSEKQLSLPLTVSKVYYFLKKEGEELYENLGYSIEEFTNFRKDLFRGEVRPRLSVTQLLAVNLLVDNQNKPVSSTNIRTKIGIPRFAPDVKHNLCREKNEIVERGTSFSKEKYNLIESVQYYPSPEDFVFLSSPRYSEVFLGRQFSSSALSAISERYGPKRFIDLMEKYIRKRTKEIEKLRYEDIKFRKRLLEDALIEAKSWIYRYNKH